MRTARRTSHDALKLARRWFTLDFKIMVIRHKKENALTCAATGRAFNVMPRLVRIWEELYDAGQLTIDAGRRPVTLHQAEVSKLRAELSRMKIEVASLRGTVSARS
jgi:transposase-like protein